jgi:enoyl-CoA hydratase/3-hydroxyacyl-CoA dehydrogenase
MNRPDKLNALNEEMWEGLNEAFLEAERDPEVRAVVITGKGRAFCAGDDIAVMGSWKSFLDGKEFFTNIAMPLLNTISNYKKPVISLVNGIAFGGGLELNLAFDIVIASDDAVFSVPEGLIGAMPPIASSLGLAVIGRRMIRYCLTGDQMDAEEAKQLGIVDISLTQASPFRAGEEVRGSTTGSRRQEKEAEVFAAYLLIPEDKLNEKLREEWLKSPQTQSQS